MRPCAVLLPAGVLSVTGSSVWFFGRVVGEGKVCVCFLLFLLSLNVSVSRVAMLAGDGFVSAVKAVLLMFGAPER